MRSRIAILMLLPMMIIPSGYSWAGDIPYQRSVSLSVGQSTILKGVRTECDGNRAPSFASLRLPKPKTGRLSNGGTGTVESGSCGKTVPARAIKFTATKKGSESITIYKDRIKITVK